LNKYGNYSVGRNFLFEINQMIWTYKLNILFLQLITVRLDDQITKLIHLIIKVHLMF